MALSTFVLSAAAQELPADHAARMERGLALFERSVAATLMQHCLDCHGAAGVVESELDLSSREKLLAGGLSGVVVVPYKPDESLLVRLISHTAEPKMPLEASRLSDEEIRLIAEWIECGAPYESSLVDPREAAEAWTERVVEAAAREHWAFQPLAEVEPPPGQDAAESPIDRFLQESFDQAGIRPVEEADRRALARRAYFDLIGLPPTPEELRAFLDDTSDAAYGRMIDRLLASPRYGERWARHWLDLARFAESHGFEHDSDRATAYHYRDFVIEALNQDLPYDTFIKWQLAGDEFAPNNRLAMMATGFLAAGVHSTQITANEVEKHRYDEMDDMLATTGTTVLGLTIGCARCHDHKFDPIPQRDYYRLLSAFTTTVRSEVDWDLDPAGYERAKAAFDAEHSPYQQAIERDGREGLPRRFASWRATWPDERENFPWRTIEFAHAKSNLGEFDTLADGSLLALGRDASDAAKPLEIYTFEGVTNLVGARFLRLEALADPTLPHAGPGQLASGVFQLGEVALSVSTGKQGKGRAIKLTPRHATAEEKERSLALAIDGDDKTHWSIKAEDAGRDHAAIFELEAPLDLDEGDTLTFTLRFRGAPRGAIGRVRLALAANDDWKILPAHGGAIPESLASLLDRDTREVDEAALERLLPWYATVDERGVELARAAEEHARLAPKRNMTRILVSSEGVPALRLHTQGQDFFDVTHFLRRGDVAQKEGVAEPGFLQVLMRGDADESAWLVDPPAGARTSWRRAALANWLTDVDAGAGALAARVMVNRLWQHHFGRGIVATPSDFGTRGAAPTRPDLLDWLASELIRHEWRLKPIHKLIMTSAAYRRSSEYDAACAAADPENHLYWRQSRRRLEAETIRDALLAVSGELDTSMYGPGTLDVASRRRSVYFTVKRSQLVPMMQVFDAPDALSSMGERGSTTIAPQALYLMNNPQVHECAAALARCVSADASNDRKGAIENAFIVALSRPPSEEERRAALEFLDTQTALHRAAMRPHARRHALADFCQVLLCMNEFVYVD